MNHHILTIIKEHQHLDFPYLFCLISLVPYHLHLGKMLNIRIPKLTFPKLGLPLSATNVKVISMLLPTIPDHWRLPLLTKFALKPLSPIGLSPRKSLLWLRSSVLLPRLSRLLFFLLLPQVLSTLFLSRLYCRHHLLRFHYCLLLLSLSALIADLFLLYCRHLPCDHGACQSLVWRPFG